MKNTTYQSVIDRLLNLSQEERLILLNDIYKKNRSFFKRKMQIIDKFLTNSKCPYRIDLTKKFLNIVHEPTGELGHPSAGLDDFAKLMGDWVHNAWVDLFNFRVATSSEHKLHSVPVARIFEFINRNFPAYTQNYSMRQINLKVIDDDRRFSPPVIFLGIFHGLHIDYFLSRTDVPAILFMEPELERFEVSCYFLDYEAIWEKLSGRMFLALGENDRSESIQGFFLRSNITPLIWTRVLPGYSFPKAPVMIESLKMLQRVRTDIFYPLDFEMEGLINGWLQIKKKRFLLSEDIVTSSQCRIAIVATGPSLINDIEWLKRNQHKLIIFAVHSSVKVLKQHGIIPDFQFSLDIHLRDAESFAMLDFYRDKPIIQYYKVTDEYFDIADQVFLVAERQKPNPVFFNKTLDWTHPSTTCLAFSFADFCSPREIFLIGCDFGYRSAESDHAKGSFYDTLTDEKGEKIKTHYGTTLQALMPSNFNETELLQTSTFLSHSKMVVEMRIKTTGKNYKVFNLSDGVAIRKTIPKRSSGIRLPKYVKKQKDVDKIMRAFKRAEQNKNWKPYAEKGDNVLLDFKKKVVDRLSLEKFSWMAVADALDRVLGEEIGHYFSKNDWRMDIYMEVMTALLGGIYCCLIFCDSEKDAAEMYESAIGELDRIFEQFIQWPAELGDIP